VPARWNSGRTPLASTAVLADTGGACSVRNVLFCAYPSDPCSATSGCTFPMICVPNDDYQGRRCGKGLPMYP
jgi:hypothetical protein